MPVSINRVGIPRVHQRMLLLALEPPGEDLVDGKSANDNRPLFAEDGDGLLEIPRIDIRCPLNQSDGSVPELENPHTEILGFDIRMVKIPDHPVNRINIPAENPLQQVDIMRALVHEGTAVHLPSPPPGGLIVVILIPVPKDP